MEKISKFLSEFATKRVNRRVIDHFSFLAKGNKSFTGKKIRKKRDHLTEIINHHFINHTNEDHPNRVTLTKALELLG